MNFILALLCSIIFFCVKFGENKIFKKNTPMKEIMRNSVLVGFSVIVGELLSHQFDNLANITSSPVVFINEPSF
jgi:hypothetical protein